jgi:acetoacetate decarboxylase
MTFIFQPDNGYFMPVSFGPAPELFKTLVYKEILGIEVSFLTDKDALAARLPAPFEPADQPVVTIYYYMTQGCEFLAWRPYNLMGVGLSAVFKGKKDYVPGLFGIIEWEGDPYAAIIGRELLGDNKLYADVSDVEKTGNTWRCHCSEFGSKLTECEVRNVTEVNEDRRRQIEQESQESLLIGWKYISKADGTGPELSAASTIPFTNYVSKAWVGEGGHKFHKTSWESTPASFRVTQGLQTLVAREYLEAVILEGSMDLPITESRLLE